MRFLTSQLGNGAELTGMTPLGRWFQRHRNKDGGDMELQLCFIDNGSIEYKTLVLILCIRIYIDLLDDLILFIVVYVSVGHSIFL